jgi:4-hydroxybenzoate polyprenyltransferase
MTEANISKSISGAPPAGMRDYLAIARFDHMTKHVFIIPGIVLAYILRGIHTDHLILNLILGLVSATCVAAANYVINEWLDRDFDKFHPSKSKRTAVNLRLNRALVYGEYAVLVAIGLLTAFVVGLGFFIVSIAFVLSGIIYNVEPFRTKDHAFVDV